MKINEIISDWQHDILTQLAEKILIDCQYYFSINPRAINSINQTLYRGMNHNLRQCEDILNPIAVRSDRQPLNTSKFKHTVVDDWLFDRFKWRPRSAGLFATADYRTAGIFGLPYAIFPIGEFKMLWSNDIDDLTEFLVRNLPWYTKTEAPEVVQEGIETLLSDCRWKESISNYFDRFPSHELILGCKNYYAIPCHKNHPCGSIQDLLLILQKLM